MTPTTPARTFRSAPILGETKGTVRTLTEAYLTAMDASTGAFDRYRTACGGERDRLYETYLEAARRSIAAYDALRAEVERQIIGHGFYTHGDFLVGIGKFDKCGLSFRVVKSKGNQ